MREMDRNDTLIPAGAFFLMDDDKLVAVARDDVWIWERKILELERMGCVGHMSRNQL